MFDEAQDDVMRELAGWVAALAELPREVSDAQRVERLRLLEDLKCAAEGAQARDEIDLDASQREEQERAGVPARRRGEGVAAQVALARRQSPHKGARLLGLAKVLEREMPHTFALMRRGRLSEWRATILARESACLELAHRAEVDRVLCSGEEDAVSMSDRALGDAARRMAARLDAASVVERARRAETERTVSIRPAPDTMTWVSALLPVTQGVALYAALGSAADAARATGDPRSRGQLLADTLVARATRRGATRTEPDCRVGEASTGVAGVQVQLVMTDRSLLAGDEEPAHLQGYGSVPAPWARELVGAAVTQARAWVRRLYTTPGRGALVAMDSTARCAPSGLAAQIEPRDQGLCRTPWCGAPIRAVDHVIEHRSGGPTAAANLQGLCERCNLAKQAPGWVARPRPGPRHTVDIQTPTGHSYRSRAPAPPGTSDAVGPESRLRSYLTDLVLSV